MPITTDITTIFPSLISADLLNLEAVLVQFDPHCAGYHLDIMDNQFVPNLTWGPAFVNAIARKTKRIPWVHLMVNNPESIIDQLELPENSIISVHLESVAPEHLLALIQKIKNKNWRPSLAIKPKTPVSALEPYLELVDHVLIMSVEPGFSGQEFIPSSEQKIEQLLARCKTHAHNIALALDGGINTKNIADLTRKGVTQFAAAHAIFGQPDPVKSLDQLQKLANQKSHKINL